MSYIFRFSQLNIFTFKRYSQLQDLRQYVPYDLPGLSFVFWNYNRFQLGLESPLPFTQTSQSTSVRTDHLPWLWARQKMHRFNTQTERKMILNSLVNTKNLLWWCIQWTRNSAWELLNPCPQMVFFFLLHIEVSSKIKTECFQPDFFFPFVIYCYIIFRLWFFPPFLFIFLCKFYIGRECPVSTTCPVGGLFARGHPVLRG